MKCSLDVVTPCSRVHLENLTVINLFEKFPVLCGAQKSVTMFGRARHYKQS